LIMCPLLSCSSLKGDWMQQSSLSMKGIVDRGSADNNCVKRDEEMQTSNGPGYNQFMSLPHDVDHALLSVLQVC